MIARRGMPVPYGILPEAEIQEFKRKALEVLEETGVFYEFVDALEVLEGVGCRIDYTRRLAFFPAQVVEEAVASAPKSITLYDREGNPHAHLEGNNVHFDPGSSAVHFLNSDGLAVDSSGEDLASIVRVTDALEHIALQSTAVVACEVAKEVGDSYRLYIVLKNSTKPIVTGAFTASGAEDMKEILVTVRGSLEALKKKPMAIMDVCPSSPLRWTNTGTQNIMDISRWGIPVEFLCMPMSGASTPVTLAGTIVCHVAENLSGLVLAQAVNPGAPVVWGGGPMVFDMRYGTTPMSAIEAMMMSMAACQVGKALGLPTHAMGCLSDSKVVDVQAGLESGMGALLAGMAGVNVISGPGILDFVGTQCLEKLVVDNEICGMVLRFLKGIEMDDDAFGIDVIRNIGPGGDFLNTSHTRRWFREEVQLPGACIDRQDRKAWHEAGSTTALTRANRQVKDILASHKPRPLERETERALDAAIKKVARRHGVPYLPRR